ncbi:MAG: succinyl-diaminopimelate desuccinylase [Gammaproteobacteria bacterium]|nr:succinyl-diaminopimelate desuccinylase [Gammaproteobacteria bacterium]MYB38949.1 succinyl-diaminopimelate desuccinylase [Gammaproteobacteria bacterium]
MDDPTEAVLAFTKELIARPSVSPNDAGCQELIGERLVRAGFALESMPFGAVDNLWATHGQGAPLVVFAGHTDVVPPGPEEAWDTPPFEPKERDGWLYGRGAADMKSSLAAMVVAAERFLGGCPKPAGTLAFLITSDEEADAVDGTVRVVETLTERGIQIDHCVVGEPSSTATVGDVIRVGRRGSLSGSLTIAGIQGHVAYPDDALNPIHASLAALADLASRHWDEGSPPFPPTTFQISNIRAGTGAGNVIPGELLAAFNFRFNPSQTEAGLRAKVERALASVGAPWHVDWRLSGPPFFTASGTLTSAVQRAIEEVAGHAAEESTSGGTSDGRFIAPTGAEVVELGPVNATIHKVNERVQIADLAPLTRMYESTLARLLA